MYHFVYADRTEIEQAKKKLAELIHEVQNDLRGQFTFQYRFIGSSARNMVTFDPKTNIGFDLDVNIEINDDEEKYSPKEIRSRIEHSFYENSKKYGYNAFEKSKRVFTIKQIDHQRKRIMQSCDIAIVNNFMEEGQKRQEYIAFHKSRNSYVWEEQSKGFMLEDKENWLKQQGAWNAVREQYLEKKNLNSDPQKHSRSLYAETIKEISDQYGFATNTNEYKAEICEGYKSIFDINGF